MNDKASINGFKGKKAHPDFVTYTQMIVNHPVYAGMPDPYYRPEEIQWEAPSNRTSGQFKNTHHNRRGWWEEKAASVGIDPETTHWISRTAKKIHPTKEKPCKACGHVLRIGYFYPTKGLLNRVQKLKFFTKDFILSDIEPIDALVERLYDKYGDPVLERIPHLLQLKKQQASGLSNFNLDSWLSWIEKIYVPTEPRSLSPGAMSNAPDRFDGFHSFNRCCRGKADSGRLKSNLSTYVTDRRVFEYWAAGDWISANHLMGRLRTEYPEEICRHGHPGPCQADHIGPISLGFTHRPKFQMLCRLCNSAKNNRMSLMDVNTLIGDEKKGDEVVSWHSKMLWDECKKLVDNEEKALRLSKLLRDNRHNLMFVLKRISDCENFLFLTTLLDLTFADHSVSIKNLEIRNHFTEFDELQKRPRNNEYAREQKARRCRIALESLIVYFKKENRNSFEVRTELSASILDEILAELKKVPLVEPELENLISAALDLNGSEGDSRFRILIPLIEQAGSSGFDRARNLLKSYMDEVGRVLAGQWSNERYVR